MSSVSLVCTVHGEIGLANVSGLWKILKHFQPDVCFLEVPPAALDNYINTVNEQTLESMAIKKYRESHQVELVPVDLATPGGEFFANSRYMFERIERSSHEYRRLMDLNSSFVGTHGFAYLNSEDCSNIWSAIYREIRSAVERLEDRRLVELYEMWIATIALRDQEMIRNVENYSRLNMFEKGVFLVGASHRQSIIDCAGGQSGVDSNSIQWDFDGLRTFGAS